MTTDIRPDVHFEGAPDTFARTRVLWDLPPRCSRSSRLADLYAFVHVPVIGLALLTLLSFCWIAAKVGMLPEREG